MPDAFVSYARRDTEFIARLVEGMQEHGKSVWLDTEGIADGEVFPQALRSAIEESDAFVFVITPESVSSDYCEQEVEHARTLGKRIVPVLREAVPDGELHPEVRDRNWIPFAEDDRFDDSMRRLVNAMDSDLEHAKEHTRWGLKAIEWENEGRDSSFLLRGAELGAAESWLAGAAGKDPAPTALQSEYLLASRAAASRRQRTLVGISAAVAAVSVALLVFALISRSNAVSAEASAKSRALAAQAENQFEVDPELALLLAREAVNAKDTPEARIALRGALDASPLLARLPDAGRQECGLSNPFPYAAYTPDGESIVEVRCDGTAAILGAGDGAEQGKLDLGVEEPSAAALSPDGRELAVGSKDGVSLVDLESGDARETVKTDTPADLAFSPDGRRLAIGTNGALLSWEVGSESARTLARTPGRILVSVVFMPDGRRIVTGGNSKAGDTGGVDVYDASTGAHERQIGDRIAVDRIAVSPDGRRLAIAETNLSGDGTGRIDLWDTRTWQHQRTVTRLPSVEAAGVAFSPDGKLLAVGAADGTAGIWSLETNQRITPLIGHNSAVRVLAFSPDSADVVTTSLDGSGRIWRAAGPEQARIDDAPGTSIEQNLAFGERISASTASDVVSWAPGELARPQTMRLPSSFGGFPAPLSLDGELAAVTAPDAIQVVATDDGSEVSSLRSLRFPTAAFSPDGGLIGALGFNQTGYVADVPGSDTVALQGSKSNANCFWRSIAFGDDNRLVAGGKFCGDVVIWDAATGERLAEFENKGQISQVAFTPDGKTLAVGSFASNITLWDVETAQPLRVLWGHTGGVDNIVISPGGSRLASASLDDTVRIWDLASSRTIRILPHPAEAGGMAFSPDGSQLVTGDGDGVVRVWDTCPGCDSADELLSLSEPRITREFTPLERAAYLEGD